jgi:DNA-binding SARP family transcriptional activator
VGGELVGDSAENASSFSSMPTLPKESAAKRISSQQNQHRGEDCYNEYAVLYLLNSGTANEAQVCALEHLKYLKSLEIFRKLQTHCAAHKLRSCP